MRELCVCAEARCRGLASGRWTLASVRLLCTRCLTKQIAYLCSGLRFQGLVFSPQMIASRENHRQLGGGSLCGMKHNRDSCRLTRTPRLPGG